MMVDILLARNQYAQGGVSICSTNGSVSDSGQDCDGGSSSSGCTTSESSLEPADAAIELEDDCIIISDESDPEMLALSACGLHPHPLVSSLQPISQTKHTPHDKRRPYDPG